MSNIDLTVKEADGPGTLSTFTALGVGRQAPAFSKSWALAQDDHDALEALKNSVAGVAHGSAAALVNPALLGVYAAALGVNPAIVADGAASRLYGLRNGIQLALGGHPNVLSPEWVITDADGPQLNAALLAVSAGTRIVVTQAQVAMSGSNTGEVAVRVGIAAATLPAASPSAGANGILLSGKFSKNGGISRGTGAGIILIGGDGEDLRITCDDPVGGDLRLVVSYFTLAG